METHLKTLFTQFLDQATPQQLTYELTTAKAKVAKEEDELKTAKDTGEIEEIRERLAYEKEMLAMVQAAIQGQETEEYYGL